MTIGRCSGAEIHYMQQWKQNDREQGGYRQGHRFGDPPDGNPNGHCYHGQALLTQPFRMEPSKDQKKQDRAGPKTSGTQDGTHVLLARRAGLV